VSAAGHGTSPARVSVTRSRGERSRRNTGSKATLAVGLEVLPLVSHHAVGLDPVVVTGAACGPVPRGWRSI